MIAHCKAGAGTPRKLLYRRPGTLRMSAKERACLVDFYRDDIRRLEGVLDRDLSGWLQ